jgi:hypothetical protein
MEGRRMKGVTGVLICIPAYGQSVSAQTLESVCRTTRRLTRFGIRNELTWFSGADIVEVRNLFLTSWYDCCEESHMLFVDADMGFAPKLVEDMLEFRKALTGCFYSRRQPVPSIVGAALDPEHKTADIVKGFLPAASIGGGVMLIARELVTTMLAKMPDVIDALPSVLAKATNLPLFRLIRAFDPIHDGSRRLSEDVSFCQRWRDCGGEIWANVHHRISHVGPFDYAIRYEGIMAGNEEAKARQEAAAA